MRKTLLLLFIFLFTALSIFAQTDKAEYAAIQEYIAGAAVTWSGTVYSFAGTSRALEDGNLFPDTLSLDGVNSLIRQEGSAFGRQTTIDTWWSPSNNTYYVFELVNNNCDAGVMSAQIISFPKDDPTNLSTVGFDVSQSLLGDVSLVVAGNRFALIAGRSVVTADFNDPLDTVIINLQNFERNGFPSRSTTIGDKIYIADGSRLVVIDSIASVTEIELNEEVLGLGTHGFSSPGIMAITPSSAVKLRDSVVIENAFFDENYTFESLVMNPFGRTFLCTYREGAGDLRYGLGSEASSITSFTKVDVNNPGRYVEYLQTSTSTGGNARSIAVIEFENSLSSILMSTQNAVEFVDIDHADIDIVSVEMEYEDISPTYRVYFARPTIRNNSSITIESVQVEGEIFVAPCPVRDTKIYENLELLPGEERQLGRFRLSSPALGEIGENLTGTVNLSSANNFPIKQGNRSTATGVLTVSSTSETFAQITNAFPNPANTTVQVELPAGAIVQSASARDLLGRDVTFLAFQGKDLDVSALMPGVYLVELQLVDSQLVYVKLLKR